MATQVIQCRVGTVTVTDSTLDGPGAPTVVELVRSRHAAKYARRELLIQIAARLYAKAGDPKRCGEFLARYFPADSDVNAWFASSTRDPLFVLHDAIAHFGGERSHYALGRYVAAVVTDNTLDLDLRRALRSILFEYCAYEIRHELTDGEFAGELWESAMDRVDSCRASAEDEQRIADQAAHRHYVGAVTDWNPAATAGRE